MNRFKFLLVKLILLPLNHMPLSWAQALGARLGRYGINKSKKYKHIALTNIKKCFPDLSKQAQQELFLKNGEETGKWFLESTYAWFRSPKYLAKKIHISNPEVLDAAYKQKKGVIILVPHLGNFEMLNYYIPFHYPFASLYRPRKSALLEYIISHGRSRVGTSMFAVDARGVRAALKHLKAGKVLAVLSDHLPTKNTGVFAPFFGLPAHTGKLTQTLARFNHSQVLLAATIRMPKGYGYEATFFRVEGLDCKDPVESATLMNQAFEKAIRLAPEQYQWVYRRFSRQPDNRPSIYQKQ